jgi:hypothetical protein
MRCSRFASQRNLMKDSFCVLLTLRLPAFSASMDG